VILTAQKTAETIHLLPILLVVFEGKPLSMSLRSLRVETPKKCGMNVDSPKLTHPAGFAGNLHAPLFPALFSPASSLFTAPRWGKVIVEAHASRIASQLTESNPLFVLQISKMSGLCERNY